MSVGNYLRAGSVAVIMTAVSPFASSVGTLDRIVDEYSPQASAEVHKNFDFNETYNTVVKLINAKTPFTSPKYIDLVDEIAREYHLPITRADIEKAKKEFRIDYFSDEIIINCPILQPDGVKILDFRIREGKARDTRAGPNGELIPSKEYPRTTNS